MGILHEISILNNNSKSIAPKLYDVKNSTEINQISRKNTMFPFEKNQFVSPQGTIKVVRKGKVQI